MDQTTDLQLFQVPGESLSVRVVTIDGEPWLVAADVTRALGVEHSSSMTRYLPSDEKGVFKGHTPSGQQELTIISESGFYRLVMRSNRPEAERFQSWVTREVLPSIRKTGSYGVQRELSRRELLEMALAAEDRADALSGQLGAAFSAIKELEPSAQAYEELIDLRGLFAMSTVAKAFGVGTNRLFAHLRQHGTLIGTAGERFNTPYQRHVEAGRFEIKLGTREHRDGTPAATYTTMVTPKGVDFIRKLLRSYPV